MIKPIINLLLVVAVLAVFIVSCKPVRDPCLEPKIVTMRAHIYRHADTGSAIIDSPLTSPVLTAIDAPLVPNSFIYTARTSLISFTLNGSADSTRWVLRPEGSATAPADTITFRYNHQLQFLSTACGYTYFYSLTGVANTRHAVDSVFINNSSVTSVANVEHIKIYYRH